MDDDTIIVVSGLPRSGTSMMMQMLEAGGIEPLTDHERKADTDNPAGYYEFERVKQLRDDTGWLPDARGKAVKVISALLRHLPNGFHYKVIFMERRIEEVIASQSAMLERRGKRVEEEENLRLATLFKRHLADVKAKMTGVPSLAFIELRYDDVVENPLTAAARVNEFLGGGLDVTAMATVIDPTLYRQH